MEMGNEILLALVFFILGGAVGSCGMGDFMAERVRRLEAEIAKFDGDGDGHIGGSKPRSRPPVSKNDWML